MPGVGLQVALTASGGRLYPLPPTNSVGVAETFWHAEALGLFWIYARYGNLRDSAGVMVEP